MMPDSRFSFWNRPIFSVAAVVLAFLAIAWLFGPFRYQPVSDECCPTSEAVSDRAYSHVRAAKGDWVVAALEYMPETFDPFYAVSPPALEIVNRTHEGLLRYDDRGELKKGLARSYTVTLFRQDATADQDSPTAIRAEIIFSIDENIKWHNGKVVTASDIVDGLKEMLARDSAPYAGLFDGLENLYARSEHEVVAEYSKYSHLALHAWVQPLRPAKTLNPAQQSTTEQKNSSEGDNLIWPGTGPFVIRDHSGYSHHRDSTIYLVRNEHYRKGAPNLNGMVYRVVPDQSTRVRLLGAGQLDLAPLYPVLAARLKNSEDALHNVIEVKDPAFIFIGFNSDPESPHYVDKAIRRDLHGINRQDMIDQVYHGFATPIFCPVLPVSPLASRRGQETGINGTEVGGGVNNHPIELIAGKSDPDMERLAMIAVEQWTEAGYKARLRLLEEEDFDARLNKRDFQAFLAVGTVPFSNDQSDFWSSDGPLNFTGHRSEKIDHALYRFKSSTEKESYTNALLELSAALAEEIPALFLLQPHTAFAVEKRIESVEAGLFDFRLGPERWHVSEKNQIYGSSVHDDDNN